MPVVLSYLFGCNGHCSSLLSACMEDHRETKVLIFFGYSTRESKIFISEWLKLVLGLDITPSVILCQFVFLQKIVCTFFVMAEVFVLCLKSTKMDHALYGDVFSVSSVYKVNW